MADENVLVFKIEDDTSTSPTSPAAPRSGADYRHNPLLDDFMSGKVGPTPAVLSQSIPKPSTTPSATAADALNKIDRRNPLFVIAEIAKRLEQGLITADEALDRAKRAAKSGGDAYTDYLREQGIGGRGVTGESFFRDRIRRSADRSGELASAIEVSKKKNEEEKPEEEKRPSWWRTALGLGQSVMHAGRAIGSGNVTGAVVGTDAAIGVATKALPVAAEGSATALAGIGTAATAVAGPLIALAAAAAVSMYAAKKFGEMLAEVAERGKELAGYDARIAQARASQEVSILQNQIREAQQLGADYQRLINSQTAIGNNLTDMNLQFQKLQTKISADAAMGVEKLSNVMVGPIEKLGEILNQLYDATTAGLDLQYKAFKDNPLTKDIVVMAKDFFDRDKNKDVGKQVSIDMMLDQARRQFRVPGGNVGDNGAGAARDRLNLQLPFGVQVPAAVPMGGNA